MINTELMWMFLAPILLSAIGFLVIPKLSNGGVERPQAAIVMGIALLISCLALSIAFYIGKGSKTGDTEIWNGQVTAKARTQGSYVESYSCNCRTVSSGSGKNKTTSEKCDTCYRDHFTVNWGCQSTIGSYTIDSKDWTSRAVYLLPDPNRYTIIKVGDPVSKTHDYTNFIKAVPETLFRPLEGSLKAQFAGQIPVYPGNIYDYYHVDRVLAVGVPISNLREWNDKLSDTLKTLGPAKQANVVIVITKSADPNYFYALQDAWLNGKKNDIVVVIGAPGFPAKAEWVNIMALTQDNAFQVKLRDDILALDTLTADSVIKTINDETVATFKRKRMHDFAYLDAEIDPPSWVMTTMLVLILLGYIGGSFAVINQSSGFRRYRY